LGIAVFCYSYNEATTGTVWKGLQLATELPESDVWTAWKKIAAYSGEGDKINKKVRIKH